MLAEFNELLATGQIRMEPSDRQADEQTDRRTNRQTERQRHCAKLLPSGGGLKTLTIYCTTFMFINISIQLNRV